MVIVLRSIHRVEKKKKQIENEEARTEMFKYIFVMTVMGAERAPGVDGITVQNGLASRLLQIGRRVLLSGYPRKGISLCVETARG